MADSVVERDGRRSADDSLAELRSLIVGPEQRELLALQSHLPDPSVYARDVSRVLPDALALRATDPQLTRALAPLGCPIVRTSAKTGAEVEATFLRLARDVTVS